MAEAMIGHTIMAEANALAAASMVENPKKDDKESGQQANCLDIVRQKMFCLTHQQTNFWDT